MRISVWSSDVCSSDLARARDGEHRQPDRIGNVELAFGRVSVAHIKHRQHRGDEDRDQIRQIDEPKNRPVHQQIAQCAAADCRDRSEEHTSELQSLMRISYAVFCLKKKKRKNTTYIT